MFHFCKHIRCLKWSPLASGHFWFRRTAALTASSKASTGIALHDVSVSSCSGAGLHRYTTSFQVSGRRRGLFDSTSLSYPTPWENVIEMGSHVSGVVWWFPVGLHQLGIEKHCWSVRTIFFRPLCIILGLSQGFVANCRVLMISASVSHAISTDKSFKNPFVEIRGKTKVVSVVVVVNYICLTFALACFPAKP